MNYGYRKPSIKKSISARTTARVNRAAKKAINPLYGKKGTGIVNDTEKAIYNKVYNKTTVGTKDILQENGVVNNKGNDTNTSVIAWIITIGITIWLFSKMWSFINWLVS